MLIINAPTPPIGVPQYLNIPFPEKWNECSLKQLLHISRFVLQHQFTGKLQHTGRAILFMQIFKPCLIAALKKQYPLLPRWVHALRARRTVAYLTAQDMGIALIDHFAWVWNSNTLTKQPFSTSTSPASSFNDITVAQFEDAHILASIFHASKDIKYLQMLSRVLYSVPPAQYHTLPHAEDPGPFKNVPVENLFLAYQWFTACHAELAEQFSRIFISPKGDKKKNNQPPDLTAFTKLVHSATGSELGTLTQVRTLPLKAFLFHIQHKEQPAK